MAVILPIVFKVDISERSKAVRFTSIFAAREIDFIVYVNMKYIKMIK